MKKVMIIGAGPLQVPAIIKAKAMGCEVAVVDKNPNASGIQIADHFYNVSTIDIDGVAKVAKEYNPDGIMTIGTDMPMRAIASAAKEVGIPAISCDTALSATDKHKMIECFKNNNVPSPWFYMVHNQEEFLDILEILTPPYIIKPSDNSGSRGVVLVTDNSHVMDAYKYSVASAHSGEVLVEEYMQGPEVSVECFACNDEIHVLQITDKLTNGAPHFVEMGHSQPSRLSLDIQEQIMSVAKSACKAVGINVGPAHVEIIVTNDGPKMVEIGARMGGDCITSHLVPLSTGIDMIAATISQACGEIPDIACKCTAGSAIRYIYAKKGKILSITGTEKALLISGVKEVTLTKSVGEYSSELCSSTDRFGYVIAQGNDVDSAAKICEVALACICVEIE